MNEFDTIIIQTRCKVALIHDDHLLLHRRERRKSEMGRHLLYECLCIAIGHVEYDPFSDEDIRKFKRELIMLVEAAYLIQKTKYPDRVYSTE